MIKMTNGVYGTKNGMKRAADGPFSLSAEEEARLVARGVAEYVDDAPVGFNDVPPVPPELPDLPDGVTPIPEYSINNTAQELREIGKLCGLTFKVGTTKADMVAALDAHIEANMVDGADLDDEDQDQDEPPTFDAAEAVQ